MKLINTVTTIALLISGAFATPVPSLGDKTGAVTARGSGKVTRVQPPVKPKEYWLDPALQPVGTRSEKNTKNNVGEYWLAVESAGKKRAVLEPNCTQIGSIVTCSYTVVEVEAARGHGNELQGACSQTTEGLTCVYDVAAE